MRGAAGAHRPVRHAEAHRGGGAFPGRQPCRRCEAAAGSLPHRRHRLQPCPRPRHRGAAGAAGGGDVPRGVGFGLRPPRRAGEAAAHHADLREYPAAGRAHHPPPRRTPGQRPGGRAPRQPVQGTAPGRRAAPQGRPPAGAGGHRVAGTGHRHRRRRAGLPDRLAALHRRLPAAGRALRAQRRRHAQGPAVPHLAGRPDRMHGAARQRAPRRAGQPGDPPRAAGRAGAADRRRSGLPRMARGRAVPPADPRAALCRPVPRHLRQSAAHARRGLHQPRRPARRLPAPRCGQPHAARPARGEDDRRDLRRNHPRQRRLRRAAGAAGAAGGHGERGLRGGKPGRRRVPARQHFLPHPARRTGPRARRGCPGPAAEHPVLAGRGAGAQRRAVGQRVAPARTARRVIGRRRGQRRTAGAGHRMARSRTRP
ncbi:hypothetical protein D9M69_422440 [compost metagenome]